jgi:DNA polymerase-3 subunit alpha
MLGLYVSDHPLMGAEGALRREVDCTLAELRELRDGDTRWVGGVITGLSRKYTKKGDLMAVFTLEDLQAAIEVMVFPKTMHEYGPQLADDAVVCVKGRLDLREEPAKIVALEVRRPALSLDDHRELCLTLPVQTLTTSLVERLKHVLREHPGGTRVVLHVGDTRVRLPDEFNVDDRNGLVAELRTLPGPIGLLG